MSEWGGSGIEAIVFGFILGKVPPKGTIVELGSGNVSTRELRKYYKLYSVDNNKKYIGVYDGVEYIYAPEIDGWYDTKILADNLPKKMDLVLIDGINRMKILDHLDLFDKDAVFVIHDTYRDTENKLAFELAERLDRPPIFYDIVDHWAAI